MNPYLSTFDRIRIKEEKDALNPNSSRGYFLSSIIDVLENESSTNEEINEALKSFDIFTSSKRSSLFGERIDNLEQKDLKLLLENKTQQINNSVLSPLDRKKELIREDLAKFVDFKVYNNIEAVFEEWDCVNGQLYEVKFVRPLNLADWQSTIYRCSTMVKILKTIDYYMPNNTDRYRFCYIKKSLYRNTTYVFGYDPANFSFVVKTGVPFAFDDLTNKQAGIHETAREQLHDLLKIMKEELPKEHFEKAFALYVLIKDKKTAKVVLGK
ncbi:hypothetical protein [Hymenobacter koreensis]|uniref:Uncharacterized protein n=1 Tax=Hymenobacter koreensis TaxID=1084523 RepID=A0ABP8IWL8_9BACT